MVYNAYQVYVDVHNCIIRGLNKSLAQHARMNVAQYFAVIDNTHPVTSGQHFKQ